MSGFRSVRPKEIEDGWPHPPWKPRWQGDQAAAGGLESVRADRWETHRFGEGTRG